MRRSHWNSLKYCPRLQSCVCFDLEISSDKNRTIVRQNAPVPRCRKYNITDTWNVKCLLTVFHIKSWLYGFHEVVIAFFSSYKRKKKNTKETTGRNILHFFILLISYCRRCERAPAWTCPCWTVPHCLFWHILYIIYWVEAFIQHSRALFGSHGNSGHLEYFPNLILNSVKYCSNIYPFCLCFWPQRLGGKESNACVHLIL